MKFDLKSKWLPYLTLLCGGVGMLLRAWLYGTGIDEGNLLVSTHPAGYLVLILSAAVIAALFWLTRSCTGQGKYSSHFPASAIGGTGAFLGAAGLLLTAMIELVRRDASLSLLTGFLGIAAAAALAFTGYCRLMGRRPGFIFHTVLCLYFVLRLISRYQSWSSDPQLHDYCFQLLATVCTMLYSYHHAALDLKVSSRRRLVLLGLLGTYFSCLSMVRSDAVLLYAGMTAWMITNLGTLETPAEPSGEGA